MIKDLIKKSVLYEPSKDLYGKWMYNLPLRCRYGKTFTDTWQFLSESEFWSEEKIAEYQLGELKRLIDHAYNNVPYYQKLFKEIGLHPNDFKDFADLQKIPYLTKDLINEHRDTLIHQSFPKKHLGYGTTSGSTGIPMGFYYDKRIHSAQEWAFMTHQWKRIRYKHKDKCVVLRGNVLKSIAEKKHYWKMDYANNWLIMSSYHLTDETIPLYIEKIRKFKPKFIQAYPSALQLIVSYMEKNRIEPFVSVKAVLCGSENIYAWQSRFFEKILQTRVYSWYGHSERVCLAGECEHSKFYHSFPQYGYTELINENNTLCSEENERGEIVATGFGNYVMPFIRYKTQDIAINTNSTCCCNRSHKLLKNVEGRVQEFIVAKNNRLISHPYSAHFPQDVFKNVKQFQFHQKTKGEVVFKLVPTADFDEVELQGIREELIKRLGNEQDIKLHINVVDNIPRTKSGKHKTVLQELQITY